MQKQTKTRKVKIKTIMMSKAFVRGVSDVRAGRGLDPVFTDSIKYKRGISDAWAYERGRHFGILSPHNVKIGRHINPAALDHYRDLVRAGDVI